MVVQHNLTAMNSNRMLGLTTKAQAKSTERLSSGYKINRAADDAAGLAISEKMRKQIRGLTQASANAQDGISAVQTAEGALTEVHDMLQRMNELAVKAGNGTNSESDRQSIQDEIDQLITEIDRVSETTKFNETYLLKGEGKDTGAGEASGFINEITKEAHVTEATGNIYEATMDMTNALAAGTEDTVTVTYLDEEGNKRTKDVVFQAGKDAETTAANLAEAISKDDTLKHIFKTSSDADGKIVIESKLDGTKTDGTKNKIDKIEFKSASNSGTKRLTAVTGVNSQIAKGESFTIALTDTVIGPTTAGTAPTALKADNLKDGDSITINGKTYTFDATKSTTSVANSFKSLDDLQKLLGNDYEVSAQLHATKVSKTYADDNSVIATKETDFVAKANADAMAKAVNALVVGTDFTNDDNGLKGAAHTADSADTAISYKDYSIELTITEKATTERPKDVLNFSLQVGADTTEENKISVDIESMSAKSLGIDKVSVLGKDSTNADKAVNTIADAIAQVSKQRSALGAIQNRLEHTINNLDNVVENTTSAESAIRDTDMATEMVKYSNNNILAQAGQSMLAQANQSNQGVLSLLG